MQKRPLLFFAFANSAKRYLNALPNEANDIDNLFMSKEHLCNVRIKNHTRPEDLHKTIIHLKNEIHVLHFGGHADGYQTIFTDNTHQSNPFYGKGFVNMIKGLPNLKLVFINGCQSGQMVNELYEAGVPMVIGTTEKINDTIAYELSVKFYEGIAAQNTIAEAWQFAKSYIQGKYMGQEQYRSVIFDDEEEETPIMHKAWFIKIRENAGNWKLELFKVRNSLESSELSDELYITFPRFHGISPTPLDHNIIGRDNDLLAVHNMLIAKKACVVVNGLGGIGKTTLSKYYIQQYAKNYTHILYLEGKAEAVDIFFTEIRLQEKLGIKDKVIAYNQQNDKKQAIACILDALNLLSKPVLLVIDNVYNLHELKHLLKGLDNSKYHLLLTSRQENEVFPSYALGYLAHQDACDLFMLYCPKYEDKYKDNALSLEEQAALDTILLKAGNHTLTLELLAKILNSSNVLTLISLAERLQKQVINPSLKQKLHTIYTEKEASLYEIIIQAFDISWLSNEPNAAKLLSQWTVLPTSYIPIDTLYLLLGITEKNADDFDISLSHLIENGWIQKDKEKGDSYFCHAIIQAVVREKIKLEIGLFEEMINRANWAIYNISEENPLNAVFLLPYTEVFFQYYTNENELLATLYNNAASIHDSLIHYDKSLAYHLKVLTILDKVLPENHLNLARSYYNLASTYGNLGLHDKELEYNLKALAIWEKVLPENDLYIAQSYNNLASTYGNLGLHDKELEYNLKALAIRKKILPENNPDIAISYNNIAGTYGNLGKYEKALEYNFKALAILEKMFTENQSDVALSYNNLAENYRKLGEIDKSLNYNFKALAIWEKVSPENHPNLAASYNNLALTCYYLQDTLQSLAYLQKAIEIWKIALPFGHRNTKNAVDGIGYVLMELIKAGRRYEVEGYIAWYRRECREYIEQR